MQFAKAPLSYFEENKYYPSPDAYQVKKLKKGGFFSFPHQKRFYIRHQKSPGPSDYKINASHISQKPIRHKREEPKDRRLIQIPSIPNIKYHIPYKQSDDGSFYFNNEEEYLNEPHCFNPQLKLVKKSVISYSFPKHHLRQVQDISSVEAQTQKYLVNKLVEDEYQASHKKKGRIRYQPLHHSMKIQEINLALLEYNKKKLSPAGNPPVGIYNISLPICKQTKKVIGNHYSSQLLKKKKSQRPTPGPGSYHIRNNNRICGGIMSKKQATIINESCFWPGPGQYAQQYNPYQRKDEVFRQYNSPFLHGEKRFHNESS